MKILKNSNVLTTAKRKPIKIQSDRRKKFLNNNFQSFLKLKKIHLYSQFTHGVASIGEQVNRTMKKFFKDEYLRKEPLIGYVNYPLSLKITTSLFITQRKRLLHRHLSQQLKKQYVLSSQTNEKNVKQNKT